MIDDAHRSSANDRLLRDLARRITLSVSLSDALFGIVSSPRSMHERMNSICAGTIELLGDPDQVIHLDLKLDGECPAHLRETLLRGTSEMLGNAIKHGLHERMVGRITVRLIVGISETRLTVEDDGWGFCAACEEGDGLGLTQALAEQHGGTSSVQRIRYGTRAEMVLPNRRDEGDDPDHP
ncbi:ATP-binding protein [Rhodovarius crocodyli]|uniref:ATP-binding protein n=1 Tax=Rhodovarius crocodyli TaxID=1979269 RepID=A0A437MM14_9PROT|nr:ATP-binding protein [Rhodovarius crocodyli]